MECAAMRCNIWLPPTNELMLTVVIVEVPMNTFLPILFDHETVQPNLPSILERQPGPTTTSAFQPMIAVWARRLVQTVRHLLIATN